MFYEGEGVIIIYPLYNGFSGEIVSHFFEKSQGKFGVVYNSNKLTQFSTYTLHHACKTMKF